MAEETWVGQRLSPDGHGELSSPGSSASGKASRVRAGRGCEQGPARRPGSTGRERLRAAGKHQGPVTHSPGTAHPITSSSPPGRQVESREEVFQSAAFSGICAHSH